MLGVDVKNIDGKTVVTGPDGAVLPWVDEVDLVKGLLYIGSSTFAGTLTATGVKDPGGKALDWVESIVWENGRVYLATSKYTGHVTAGSAAAAPTSTPAITQ